MKRICFLLRLFLLTLSLAASVTVRDDLFSSERELRSYPSSPVTEDDAERYENMKIYLLTGGEGSAVWENFGHSAFVIREKNARDSAFDYGIFRFDESFLPNFLLGKLYYEVWETYADYRVKSLIADDRSVSLLELELDRDKKKSLLSFLLYNTQEENRTYLYDYFKDNCATRLRDIYSWATDGAFEKWLRSEESSETIRDSVSRHLSRSTFFVSWVINYLLGPSVDGKATRWDECYLPANLEKAIEEFQGNEGEEVYTSEERKATPERWNIVLYSFFCGIALAVLSLSASYARHHKVQDFLLGLVYLTFASMSLVLLFFEFFTIHYVTHGNLNILIISPLTLYPAILHFMNLGKRRRTEKSAVSGLLMLSILVLTVAVRILLSSVLIQNIWAPAVTAGMLYASEALPLFVKRKIRE